MRHERLAALIQAQREAHLSADPEARPTHETILRILAALDKERSPPGMQSRVLGDEATRIATPPSHAALYRQVAAAIEQLQREEHER